jgi:hypothetical protein
MISRTRVVLSYPTKPIVCKLAYHPKVVLFGGLTMRSGPGKPVLSGGGARRQSRPGQTHEDTFATAERRVTRLLEHLVDRGILQEPLLVARLDRLFSQIRRECFRVKVSKRVIR